MTTITSHHPTPAHLLNDTNLAQSEGTQSNLRQQDLVIPRGPVTATLTFYQPPEDGSIPHQYPHGPPPGKAQKNFGEDEHQVLIEDLRGQESQFTLDNSAFQTLSNVHSSEHNFEDDARIKEVYYPEVERLLFDNVPGAHRILLFDHTIRRSSKAAFRSPVTRVHIDQTPAATVARVKHHLPESEAESLLQGRVRIINVWRPLNGPVLASPLAVADGSTVREEDLVGIEHRYPLRTGETAGVRFHGDQKWYYWSGMRNEDRLLLKCADNAEDVGAWGRCPHTAFVDPRTPEGAVGRESIEVRALVFG